VLGLVFLGHGMDAGLALTNGFSALFGFGAVAAIGFFWAMGFAREENPIASLVYAAMAGLLPTALLISTLFGVNQELNVFVGPILTSLAIYLGGSLSGAVNTRLNFVRSIELLKHFQSCIFQCHLTMAHGKELTLTNRTAADVIDVPYWRARANTPSMSRVAPAVARRNRRSGISRFAAKRSASEYPGHSNWAAAQWTKLRLKALDGVNAIPPCSAT